MYQKYIFSAVLVLGTQALHAQFKRSSYFFFQLAPNMQQALQIEETPVRNMREIPGRGLTFDAGYSRKIYGNWSIEAGLGGNVYNFIYASPGMRLNMANRPGPADYILYEEFPFALSLYLAPTYRFRLGQSGYWRVGAGMKVIAPPAAYAAFSQDYYQENDHVYPHGAIQSRMEFDGALKPVITMFIQKQLISRWRRLEAGIILNYNPQPITEGIFQVHTRDSHSTGTTKFYGSSLGVNVRYSLN